MTIQLNTIIERPITDARHFTSTLLAEPNVAHAWSLIQSKAYTDPASSTGGLKIPSRLPGGVPLKSWASTPGHLWDTRGGYAVSKYGVDGVNVNGQSAWTQEVPNPGSVFSVIILSNQPAGFREVAGIDFADLNLQIIPSRNANRSITATNTAGTLVGPIDVGSTGPFGSWFTSVWVFDFANKQLAASINGDAFVSADVPLLEIQPDATMKFAIGRGFAISANNQNYDDGLVSDFIIFNGDVRNSPGFLSQVEIYNATGYAV